MYVTKTQMPMCFPRVEPVGFDPAAVHPANIGRSAACCVSQMEESAVARNCARLKAKQSPLRHLARHMLARLHFSQGQRQLSGVPSRERAAHSRGSISS